MSNKKSAARVMPRQVKSVTVPRIRGIIQAMGVIEPPLTMEEVEDKAREVIEVWTVKRPETLVNIQHRLGGVQMQAGWIRQSDDFGIEVLVNLFDKIEEHAPNSLKCTEHFQNALQELRRRVNDSNDAKDLAAAI